jgi:hypothetical protein
MSIPAALEPTPSKPIVSLQVGPETSLEGEGHGALIALWVGEHAAVYLARAMKTIVVRHGLKPMSDEDFHEVTYVTTHTCADIGIRTVLYDLRAASSRCDCKLCHLHDVREPGVLAAAQDTESCTLTQAIRNFRSFKSAIDFVRPKSIVPMSAPCPWGFGRMLAEIQESAGTLVFSNYAGAVFDLPKQRAVYVHWSGDSSDAAASRALVGVLAQRIVKLNAARILIDHRHGVNADAALAENILALDRKLALKTVTHVVSIGDWPRGLDPSACLKGKEVSPKVSWSPTLKDALNKALRTSKVSTKLKSVARAA